MISELDNLDLLQPTFSSEHSTVIYSCFLSLKKQTLFYETKIIRLKIIHTTRYNFILTVLRINRLFSPSIFNVLYASQISPWLRPILLLVSVGASDGGTISVAFGGRNVKVQLHRQPGHAHQNIAEWYVQLLGHLHHRLHNA